MTAAILPIVMIVGHVVEERSPFGSQEAIRAMGRLVSSVTRRAGDGSVTEVATARVAVGDHIAVASRGIHGMLRDRWSNPNLQP